MDSSCSLTDNRSCEHLTIHDVAQLRRRHNILTDFTRDPCFTSSFLPTWSQLPQTRWPWARLEEAASACPPTVSAAHWSLRRWTCPWTTARALCCRTTFWTRRMTWTSTWMTSTRRMSQIRWNSSQTAMSWSGRVRTKIINQILYGCYSLRPLNIPILSTPVVQPSTCLDLRLHPSAKNSCYFLLKLMGPWTSAMFWRGQKQSRLDLAVLEAELDT